jgi:hypothetical protein
MFPAYKVPQDNCCCFAVNLPIDFTVTSKMSQSGFRFLGSQSLVLKINGQFDRQAKLLGDVACFAGRISFGPVHIERQANHQPTGVLSFDLLGDAPQQILPTSALNRFEGADSQPQLIAHCHADPSGWPGRHLAVP